MCCKVDESSPHTVAGERKVPGMYDAGRSVIVVVVPGRTGSREP